jgi:chromosome segregation protein
MRLKTLELKGFKSFANETVIHINQDVTGVVGPNGSGKSNIVDAIRWVLGEQKSGQLRLDKMTSVIFNGTKKKKEAQLAQVTLTFENTKNILPTEYQSVAISRILYRSGESEYRLNGVSCRLKDITTLFMDSGIGPDSYAIIALNMVEDMLSDREQARRRMFEQAAGVSKYKARKHETKLKLDATMADLERVDDLLFEIEENLKKLEKQAERTKKYYELKAEYKQLSIDLAVINTNKYKNTYKKLEEEITKDEDKYGAMEAQARQLEADAEALRKTHLDKEAALSEQQQDVNRLTGQIRGRENEKEMLRQRLTFINQNTGTLQNAIERAQRQIEQLSNEIESYQSDVNHERNQEAEYETALEAAQKKLQSVQSQHNALKGDLDDFVKEQQTAEREVIELEKQKAIQLTQMDNLRRELDRTSGEIKEQRVQIAQLDTQIKEQDKEAEGHRKIIAKIETEEHGRLQRLAVLEPEIDTLAKQFAEHNRKLDATRNEYTLTKSMVESLEGFPESIRYLSGQKEWSKNCPLLSDLIYVQEQYRTAIENYLEPYLNYYVVPSVSEAADAIKMLSVNQKGRANFFILNQFDNYQPPLVMLPGAVSATELVETDSKYKRLVSWLLGNVLLTEEGESTTLPDQEDVVLLSRTGSFARRKFTMAGGSVGLFEGKKIGRKKNLELLETQIKTLEKTEQSLASKLNAMRTEQHTLRDNDKANTLRHEKEKLNAIDQRIAGLRSRSENIQAFVASFDTKAEAGNTQIGELEKSNALIEVTLREKSEFANSMRSRLDSVDGSFRDVANQLSTFSAEYNQRNIEFIRQQNKVNGFQQELNFRKNRLTELNQQVTSSQAQLTELTEDEVFVKDEILRIEKELQAAYAKKKEQETALSAVEQTYFKARNEIHEKENLSRDLFRKQQDLQVSINKMKEKFQDVKFEMTAISERLRVEFGMTINDIINDEPNAEHKPDELEKTVGSLKRRLDTYGEINPLAVEAYDEIKERYDSIQTQRNDILGAKVNLETTIKEIEETATVRFLESFEQVRTNFIEVFRTLFTEEDTADLLLTQPDNPLESDINIIAKPKGKRPQSIAQLSGGEKTLTATALLFALYLLKPAPFCIFDEVDAPLDDANIEKFNKIIRKFSKDSQFIIVTHNKATMAAVDVIYGVYMPEQGVSSVSAVDFRALGHEAMVFESV